MPEKLLSALEKLLFAAEKLVDAREKSLFGREKSLSVLEKLLATSAKLVTVAKKSVAEPGKVGHDTRALNRGGRGERGDQKGVTTKAATDAKGEGKK